MSVSSTATLRGALVTRSTTATKVALVIGGIAFLALMAQIAVPVPGSPVPVTGQTLGALLWVAHMAPHLDLQPLLAIS